MSHPVDQRLAQIKPPPGVIVAMAGRDDIPIPCTDRMGVTHIADYVMSLLCPGESCDVYAATYAYDVANMRDLWRRGVLLGTLSKGQVERRYKRRAVK
jgi:hypothetical protein